MTDEGDRPIQLPPPGFVGVAGPANTHYGAPVGGRARSVAHEALDQWLDRCGAVPVKWDDGIWHTLKFEAAIAGYDDDGERLWSINVERREREEL